MSGVRWVRTGAIFSLETAIEILKDAVRAAPSSPYVVRVGELIFDIDHVGDLEDLLEAAAGLEVSIYSKTDRDNIHLRRRQP